MMVTTLDGIIAKEKSQNVDWSSPADKKAFIEETKKHGAIVMGDTTYFLIGKPLPGRFNLILSLTPDKFKDQEIPGSLEFFCGSPEETVAHLEGKGYQSAILGGGASTNAAFLKAGLVDEIIITVEPKVFGRGINFTEGQDLDMQLELLENKSIGDDCVLLRYKVLK